MDKVPSNPASGSHAILLVEDDPSTRDYLAAAVEADPGLRLVGAVASVAEGAALLGEGNVDVLLVDLGLPDGHGTDLIRVARRLDADTQCMVVTVFGDEASLISAVQAGARGYLLKDDSASNICRAIHELTAGGSPLSPAIARFLLRRFSEPEPAQRPTAPVAKLSERETEMLRYVVKGFTFPEIGELLGITTHTVTTHARRIYRKLEVRSRSEAVFEALARGLLELG